MGGKSRWKFTTCEVEGSIMPEFVALSPNVEVLGQTVLAVVEGMGAFRNLALEILKRHGVDNPNPEGWYRQQLWLDSFKEIYERVGKSTLNLIGQKIPENAKFPPEIDSIDKALASINVAYHINHRGGEIGRYDFTRLGPNRARLVCTNPYPCEFDLGLIQSMARRFQPVGRTPSVTHDETQPCRRKGGASCTYLVSW
jgi:hypothetical protein